MLALLLFKIAFKLLFNTKSNINRAARPRRGISFTEFARKSDEICAGGVRTALGGHVPLFLYICVWHYNNIVGVSTVYYHHVTLYPPHLVYLPLAAFPPVATSPRVRPSLTVSFRTVFGNRSFAGANTLVLGGDIPRISPPRTTDGPGRSRAPNHYNARRE